MCERNENGLVYLREAFWMASLVRALVLISNVSVFYI